MLCKEKKGETAERMVKRKRNTECKSKASREGG